MSIALNESDESSLVRLDGAIDISSAADLKTALIGALQNGKQVCVSVEKASDLDVTAFQLLWAAKREAERLGVPFALEGSLSETIRNSLRSSGLDDRDIS